jgi:hypothetical protein
MLIDSEGYKAKQRTEGRKEGRKRTIQKRMLGRSSVSSNERDTRKG